MPILGNMTEGLPTAVRLCRRLVLYASACCTIPPSRLRRATSLYTREALVRCESVRQIQVCLIESFFDSCRAISFPTLIRSYNKLGYCQFCVLRRCIENTKWSVISDMVKQKSLQLPLSFASCIQIVVRIFPSVVKSGEVYRNIIEPCVYKSFMGILGLFLTFTLFVPPKHYSANWKLRCAISINARSD